MTCKICNTLTNQVMQGTLLGKYPVQYYYCDHCGFMQTGEVHWLNEVYTRPINRSDVGYVSRNVTLADITAIVLDLFFPAQGSCVDFGGGYGMFVRLMRDRGYDFFLSDKYCPNLFASDFAASDDSTTRYKLLTAFEVFEHLEHPVRDFESMLALSENIFFSTDLLPEPYPSLEQWSYYGLEHGQHIALYSKRTLEYLAKRYGLYLRSSRHKSLHLFSRQPISALSWFLLDHRKGRWLATKLRRSRPSLLMPDYRAVVAKIKNENS